MTAFAEVQVERLIQVSKTKPLLPEKFVPWIDEPTANDHYLPKKLISLSGHPLYDTLSAKQQKELGKQEVIQTMYSYAWSEGLACLFFNRHLLTLDSSSIEYRYLVRLQIEEFQHQSMFSDAIVKLKGQPIAPSFQHRFWGKLTVKYLPADWVFMSVLAIEMVADVYGKHIRRDPTIYIVLRKVSELHHIEEGRHVHYTKMWLHRYLEKAGFFKRSLYSILFVLNIYFMRTLYVKQEIFERIGVTDPKKYQKAAYKNFRSKFAQHCLTEALEFVENFGGMNYLTRPIWKLLVL